MAKQNFGGVYANMEFPAYVWQEYPKHISTGKHGQFKIVYSEQEELALLGKLQKDLEAAPPEITNYAPDPHKEILISRAQELGVPINKKWSNTKLEAVIRSKEEEIDNLPPDSEDEKISNSPKITATFTMPESSSSNEKESTEAEYKSQLIAQAKELGIKNVNHLWGIPRLEATIVEFKAAQEV